MLLQKNTFLYMILFSFALGIFVLRGPVRAINNSADLTGPYLQAVVWRHGSNPYQPVKVLAEKFLTTDNDGKGFNGAIYPPTTSFLMSPLTFLGWKNAKMVWTFFLSIILIFTTFFIGVVLCRKYSNCDNLKIFGIITLLFSPFHTGIALGQLSILVISFMILSFLLYINKKVFISGILLAIAIGLKPQLALFGLLFFIINKQYKIVAVTIFGYMMIIGGTQLYSYLIDANQGSSSWSMWIDRVINGYGTTGGDRFLVDDIMKFNTINIQVLISQFCKSSDVVKITSLIIYIFMFVCFLFIYYKNNNVDNFVNFSLMLILMLLPVYHRFYDASALIIPISWCVFSYKNISKSQFLFLIVLLSFFFIPGGTILIVASTYLPQWIQKSFFWNNILLPHQVWALIISYFILISLSQRKNINASMLCAN